MKPAESEWQKQCWELIARHEILLQKRAEGDMDTQAWNALIADLEAHLMYGLANDMKRMLAKETA